jgi:hypothetical protein
MKHPPYPLRPNKSVDRLAMIESIRRLGRIAELSGYTYYGLGGPYLEDFRILYELCPELALVSIERDGETLKRQEFHRPCCSPRLKLLRGDVTSFITTYDPRDAGSIFWLDYVDLAYGSFEDFMALLGKVPDLSMVKVTLRAEPRDYQDNGESFRRQFGEFMPDRLADPPARLDGFARLLQSMLQIAAQRALPAALPHTFQPVCSFCYADKAGIFTLTGVVCSRQQQSDLRKAFRDWELANLRWNPPRHIDVPYLSTKERLHLQSHLPCRRYAGRAMRKALGYLIDDDWHMTEARLTQYADFHRYFPYFMKGTP